MTPAPGHELDGRRPTAGALAPRSRTATNELLALARDGGWTMGAWFRLLRAASRRSVEQALIRPRPFFEVTALHLLLAGMAGRRGRTWISVSWTLAATHLGLLEDRRSLGPANALTLSRANLPAVGHRLGGWVPALALASDFVDGKLARATGTESSFGQYADFLADTAVWTWFGLRHETSRTLQLAALAAWVAPVAVVLSGSLLRGRMVDVPRRWWFRPAATVQLILAARAAIRRCHDGAPL